MEEEAKRIIRQAVTRPENFSEVFQKHFGIENGANLELFQHSLHNPMEFCDSKLINPFE